MHIVRAVEQRELTLYKENRPSAEFDQPDKRRRTKKKMAAIRTATRPPISVHILDITRGLPAGRVPVKLEKFQDENWTFINSSETNANGRCEDLLETGSASYTEGRYKIRFEVDKYFKATGTRALYPYVDVVFDVGNYQESYHLPLLLSPFGYSTYRGS